MCNTCNTTHTTVYLKNILDADKLFKTLLHIQLNVTIINNNQIINSSFLMNLSFLLTCHILLWTLNRIDLSLSLKKCDIANVLHLRLLYNFLLNILIKTPLQAEPKVHWKDFLI